MFKIRLLLCLTLAALGCRPALAEPHSHTSKEKWDRLQDQQGVKIGQVAQFDSETKADALVERLLHGQGFSLADGTAENPPRYFYDKVDLNGDGVPEVLVYYLGDRYCGTGGCRFLIGQMRGKSYKVIARILITHMPVIISDKKTGAWHDFILCASGGGLTPTYCVYKWRGKKYDDNGKTMKAGETINGRAYISDFLGEVKGIKFK